jgi:hypothetical protein
VLNTGHETVMAGGGKGRAAVCSGLQSCRRRATRLTGSKGTCLACIPRHQTHSDGGYSGFRQAVVAAWQKYAGANRKSSPRIRTWLPRVRFPRDVSLDLACQALKPASERSIKWADVLLVGVVTSPVAPTIVAVISEDRSWPGGTLLVIAMA